jgi:predicted nucleic acid-binding protein
MREEISGDEARTAFDQLLALRVRRTDTLPLLREAWALRHNVTMADALYVVLARRLGVVLVSGDARLRNAPNLDVRIVGVP